MQRRTDNVRSPFPVPVPGSLSAVQRRCRLVHGWEQEEQVNSPRMPATHIKGSLSYTQLPCILRITERILQVVQRLPPETQTLYAEFLEQLVAMHAHRTIGYVPGCFTTKSVKGELYYYFQYSDPGGVSRQVYVGKQSPALEEVVETYARGRSERNSDTERLQRLSATFEPARPSSPTQPLRES